MFIFLTYLFITFVMFVMSRQEYMFPWFGDKVLSIGYPTSSFLWPIGFVLSLTGGLFGLVGVKDEEDK